MQHKFAVGENVELTPSPLRVAAAGRYEIRQTMPLPDVSSQSPRYRIKSIDEPHERIVAETELVAAGGRFGMMKASDPMQLPRLDED